jgi:4-hydroxybenzoate decarboxylase subunit C
VWLGLGDPVRELPRQFTGELPSGVTDVRVFCGGCLVVQAPSHATEPGAAERLAKADSLASWPLVVVTDDALRAVRSDMNFLWTTFTRFEPAADIRASERTIVRNHVCYRGPVVIDARMKPWYPKELSCRDDIAGRVGQRWKEYFPSGRVEMGDSERAHLD